MAQIAVDGAQLVPYRRVDIADAPAAGWLAGDAVKESCPVPVISGHRPSAPAASACWPRMAHHSSSLPASSRQAHSRMVACRSGCSSVNPIAPCTWWASEVTRPPAWPAIAFAALTATSVPEPGVQGQRRRLDGYRAQEDLARHRGQVLLHRLEAPDRPAERLALARVSDRQLKRPPCGPGHERGTGQGGALAEGLGADRGT